MNSPTPTEPSSEILHTAHFWYQRGRADGYKLAKEDLYTKVVEALMFGPMNEIEMRLKEIFE